MAQVADQRRGEIARPRSASPVRERLPMPRTKSRPALQRQAGGGRRRRRARRARSPRAAARSGAGRSSRFDGAGDRALQRAHQRTRDGRRLGVGLGGHLVGRVRARPPKHDRWRPSVQLRDQAGGGAIPAQPARRANEPNASAPMASAASTTTLEQRPDPRGRRRSPTARAPAARRAWPRDRSRWSAVQRVTGHAASRR